MGHVSLQRVFSTIWTLHGKAYIPTVPFWFAVWLGTAGSLDADWSFALRSDALAAIVAVTLLAADCRPDANLSEAAASCTLKAPAQLLPLAALDAS